MPKADVARLLIRATKLPQVRPRSGGPIWRNSLALDAGVGHSAKNQRRSHPKTQSQRNRVLGDEEDHDRRLRRPNQPFQNTLSHLPRESDSLVGLRYWKRRAEIEGDSAPPIE
jgi:hypothetical protein